MRALLQRVLFSDVSVDGELKGKVGRGYNILLGVMEGDTAEEADMLAVKIAKLRVFEDENGKMNLSVLDVEGEALVISQFTLCADCRKGNRPSFVHSAAPDIASPLYDYFCEELGRNGVKNIQKGVFGADMKVNILNDGPVTILLDTDDLKRSRRGGAEA